MALSELFKSISRVLNYNIIGISVLAQVDSIRTKSMFSTHPNYKVIVVLKHMIG